MRIRRRGERRVHFSRQLGRSIRCSMRLLLLAKLQGGHASAASCVCVAKEWVRNGRSILRRPAWRVQRLHVRKMRMA